MANPRWQRLAVVIHVLGLVLSCSAGVPLAQGGSLRKAPGLATDQQAVGLALVEREAVVRSSRDPRSHLARLSHHVSEMFFQRTAEHSREHSRGGRGRSFPEPSHLEDMDLMWGVPKIVWVILFDVVGLVAYIFTIWTVTNLAKKKPYEDK
mmetsp:Transcript_159404/g.511435  ORF Transcript_159404/g.511435 Transcript_159404/m.511435 type:complete len:151 (+) Transcript_159404:157-609(+)